MLCPNCSAPISDSAKFCPNCGTGVAAQGSPYAGAAAAAAESSPYAQAKHAGAQQQTAYQAQAEPQAEQSPFERGYQKGYAWATGESDSQAGWQQSDWQQQTYQQPASPYAQPVNASAASGAKNKLVAGLLGIFLGSLGIHKFYLGYNREGLIMLLLTIIGSMLTFGLAAGAMEIIGIIEGIIYLVKPDGEFYYTYEVGHKGWF